MLRDSSAEEEDLSKKPKRKKKRRCRCCPCSRCFEEESDSDSDGSDFIRRTEATPSTGVEPQMDSDYSSGEETDYSYTYQEQKDVGVPQESTYKTSFYDIEKQHLPDYASMDSYRDTTSTTPDYDLSRTVYESDESSEFEHLETFTESKKGPTVLKKRVSLEDPQDHLKEFIKLKMFTKAPPSTTQDTFTGPREGSMVLKKRIATGSFANMQDRLKEFVRLKVFTKASPSTIEEEHPLLEDGSVLEATLSTPRSSGKARSRYSTYSSSESDFAKSEKHQNVVPPLHLSSLESTEFSTSHRSDLFRNVKYEVVREVSTTTSTTSEFIHNLGIGSGTQGTSFTSQSTHDAISGAKLTILKIDYLILTYAAGSKGYDKSGGYKQKARDYYENSKNVKSADNPTFAKASSGLMKFVSKFFHKVRDYQDTFPQNDHTTLGSGRINVKFRGRFKFIVPILFSGFRRSDA